jgi:RNA recognition motif-containing protein
MSQKIYVGNLPWSFGSDDLSRLFEDHGEVISANVITDRVTGRSRGFGFVEMGSPDQAQAAIAALNGTEAGGRPLRVDLARERSPRPPRRDYDYR